MSLKIFATFIFIAALSFILSINWPFERQQENTTSTNTMANNHANEKNIYQQKISASVSSKSNKTRTPEDEKNTKYQQTNKDITKENQSISNAINEETSTEKAPLSRDSKLSHALSTIPLNFQPAFKWQETIDDELIDEYNKITNIDNNKLAEQAIEQHLVEFITQGEHNHQITIEHINCTPNGCVVYGVELHSGAWNQLKAAAKAQAWWKFNKDVTRSSVGFDGSLIFFSLFSYNEAF